MVIAINRLKTLTTEIPLIFRDTFGFQNLEIAGQTIKDFFFWFIAMILRSAPEH